MILVRNLSCSSFIIMFNFLRAVTCWQVNLNPLFIRGSLRIVFEAVGEDPPPCSRKLTILMRSCSSVKAPNKPALTPAKVRSLRPPRYIHAPTPPMTSTLKLPRP